MAVMNRLMTLLFDVCFRPFIGAPGWLSLSVFSGVAAVCGLLVYKFTSHQAAIKRTKDRIKASILAIKLFRDDLGVIASSLGRVVWCAGVLLRYAMLPLAVMIVPFVLVLAQLGLRYQWRPVVPGERVVMSARFAEGVDPMAAGASLEVDPSVVVETAPVRIPSEGRAVWRLHGTKEGRHVVRIRAGDAVFDKTLDVGRRFERVSVMRTRDAFWSALLNPAEAPLPAGSVLKSIRIAYPDRDSMIYGSNMWLVWLMAASVAMAFALKPVLKVEF